MVFASTCEHASSTFIFASMSTDEISLRAASILKIQMASSEHFVNFLDGI